MTSKPLQDLISRALRTLGEAPETPEGLRIQSAVNAAIAPRQAAADNAIAAIVAHRDVPNAENESRLRAAREDYFSAIGIDGEREAEFWSCLESAADLIQESQQNRPPPIEGVLGITLPVGDFEYELGVGLGGLQGTWHRLWAAISATDYLGPELAEDLVATIRGEFEEMLGRGISPTEWQALSTHARANATRQAARRSAREVGE